MHKGVIYQNECCASVQGVRIKEPLAGKRHSMLTTALGKHKAEEHNSGEFDIKCTILALEKEISARKALEAFWTRAFL